MEYFAKTRWKS